MNNVVMRRIVVTTQYQPLAAQELIATVEVSTPPTNAGTVYFQGDDGSDVPWVPGEYHEFKRVNLAGIKVKGTPGDVVTLVGGTW